MILNLINNAKDAILTNTRCDQGRISVQIDKTSRELTFEDNGGGIKEEVIEKVFEKFYTTKGEIEGTGIGLHMSKVIIEESFGGTIKVKNGKAGTIFKIAFP